MVSLVMSVCMYLYILVNITRSGVRYIYSRLKKIFTLEYNGERKFPQYGIIILLDNYFKV